MDRLIIIALLFVAVVTKAQQAITYTSADSITYQCYLTGDWDTLIKTGKLAIEQNIDFKRLRQRMGYAYFVTANYYAAQKYYEKALLFDENDADTRAYLYYCGLNTGDKVYARFHARYLPEYLQKNLKEGSFKPLDAVDFEFNYKANSTNLRSNPTYFRAGFSTQLGYRLSLYQSVSDYQQIIDTAKTKQPEYFALLNWSVTCHTSLILAYHYLNTSVNGIKYTGNLAYAALATKLNRFRLGLNGSLLIDSIGKYTQIGVQAGVTLPGKPNVYFNSSIYSLIETGRNSMVFSQTAGGRLSKTLWAEGNVTLGNLQNYQDHNALYIYNSIDPTIFRAGLTLFWYANKNATLFGNYTFDTKQIENTTNNYKQQSFSGGIIWKL
jgi:hypothetical protein